MPICRFNTILFLQTYEEDSIKLLSSKAKLLFQPKLHLPFEKALSGAVEVFLNNIGQK